MASADGASTVWVVWSQDTFGFGSDRDPPRVESVHGDELGAKRAEVALRKKEAGNDLLRIWTAQQPISALLEHPHVSDQWKETLRRAVDE